MFSCFCQMRVFRRETTILSLHYLGNILKASRISLWHKSSDKGSKSSQTTHFPVSRLFWPLSYCPTLVLPWIWLEKSFSRFHFSPVTHCLLQIFDFYLMYTCSLPCWTWIGGLPDSEITQTAHTHTHTRLHAELRPLIQKRLQKALFTKALLCWRSVKGFLTQKKAEHLPV